MYDAKKYDAKNRKALLAKYKKNFIFSVL